MRIRHDRTLRGGGWRLLAVGALCLAARHAFLLLGWEIPAQLAALGVYIVTIGVMLGQDRLTDERERLIALRATSQALVSALGLVMVSGTILWWRYYRRPECVMEPSILVDLGVWACVVAVVGRALQVQIQRGRELDAGQP